MSRFCNFRTHPWNITSEKQKLNHRHFGGPKSTKRLWEGTRKVKVRPCLKHSGSSMKQFWINILKSKGNLTAPIPLKWNYSQRSSSLSSVLVIDFWFCAFFSCIYHNGRNGCKSSLILPLWRAFVLGLRPPFRKYALVCIFCVMSYR